MMFQLYHYYDYTNTMNKFIGIILINMVYYEFES